MIQINAARLTITEGCEISLVGGKIADSNLRIFSGGNSRFINLDGLSFENTTLRMTAHDAGIVDGVMLDCVGNNTCNASFHSSRFEVDGAFSSGQLINSPPYSTGEPGNVVTAAFTDCAYQAGFGTGENLNAKVARLNERGTWTFLRQDLPNSDPDTAIFKASQSDIVLNVE